MGKFARSVGMVSLLLSTEYSFAFSRCYGTAELRDPEDFAQYIEKVAVYGNIDKRHILDEYAQMHNVDPNEVKAKFAATGNLDCNGYRGSAQVTGKQNVITTVAHMFSNEKTCAVRNKANQCTFTYMKNDIEITVPVESLFMTGIVCPLTENAETDWAVLRLKVPADVVPYKLPDSKALAIQGDQPVIAVARSADFCAKDPKTKKCLKDKTGDPAMIKYAEDCHIRKIYSEYGAPNYFSSDCDSAEAASGGSILSVGSGPPMLLGIVVSGSEDDKLLAKAKASGKPNMRPFDEDKWVEEQVPVTGDFLDAVNRAGH